MNPRYEAYLKTTADPKNWEFMHFIAKMKKMYGIENNLRISWDNHFHIENQEHFTEFINNNYQKYESIKHLI